MFDTLYFGETRRLHYALPTTLLSNTFGLRSASHAIDRSYCTLFTYKAGPALVAFHVGHTSFLRVQAIWDKTHSTYYFGRNTGLDELKTDMATAANVCTSKCCPGDDRDDQQDQESNNWMASSVGMQNRLRWHVRFFVTFIYLQLP